jgi:hypothetical protein
MPGHTPIGGLVIGITDRKIPYPHDAQIHLVERLETILLFPCRGQHHPFGPLQREVIWQHQPRHVRSDKTKLLIAVH